MGSQLAGLGLLLEPELPEVESLAGWEAGDVERFSEDLLWKRGFDATRMLLLARIPFLLLSVSLGALTALWAAQLYGPKAGLIALALQALSPNLLANAPLAATDSPCGCILCGGLVCVPARTGQPNKGQDIDSGDHARASAGQ